MRQTLEARRLIKEAVERLRNKSLVAKAFGVSRRTVGKWCRRVLLQDRKRRPRRGKVTEVVELSILTLRMACSWGTARIQQGLLALPPYMREAFPAVVQGVRLSRTAINTVLKRHKLNGYLNTLKSWKFFRAKRPNELWQLDLKGEFILHGRKHWFLVCIDDYSRYLLLVHHLEHYPTTQEVFNLLLPLIERHRPEQILTDHGTQFKMSWEDLCRRNGVQPLFAHPSYPQDKGKVERAIQNINREFLLLLRKFPEWLSKIDEFREWFNTSRFHRGIGTVPAALYT